MKIGIFACASKPPHLGHYKAVELAKSQNDKVYVFISKKERDGITAEQALKIWDIYNQTLDIECLCLSEITPIRSTYEFVEELDSNLTEDTAITVYADKNDIDAFKNLEKYAPKIKFYREITERIVSGTEIRKALKENNKEFVFKYLPVCDKEKVWSILQLSQQSQK